MSEHVFVGFGFGPIQSGLFIKEAYQSGKFSRIVVADIDQELVDAVRANDGTYCVNVAGADRIEVQKISGVEILNPTIEADRGVLLDALAEATEIVTSLPSVKFYNLGSASVASLITEGLKNSKVKQTIIYTAENNNHAAAILQDEVEEKTGPVDSSRVQFLNTVIGKMSQVVTSAEEIERQGIEAMTPGFTRAFMVEEFNRILVAKCGLEGFTPGINVFIEKQDLLPFEEAKLYGHNAIHALLAYLGAVKGYEKMSDLDSDARLMELGWLAFLNESGAALIDKYKDMDDELFTPAGYKDYAQDLLKRMTNRYLTDTVARAGRDPVRKLGSKDRVFGTMSLALQAGIEPVNMAMGALAGIAFLGNFADENELPNELRFDDWRQLSDENIEAILRWIWQEAEPEQCLEFIRLTQQARVRLVEFVG